MKCNHEGKMFPVKDDTGWNVGFLCDCGYFEHRKGIPSYEERMKEKVKSWVEENLLRLRRRRSHEIF